MPYVGILGTGSLPPFIHGMVNGSVSAGIYELVAVVLSCIIWYLFFKMLDKQALEEENRIKEEKANKISRIKALQAVSGGSMSLLGVIMVGAIFSVLTSITWAPYQNFLKATHLLTIIDRKSVV
mgnify:CR=1 FL=1